MYPAKIYFFKNSGISLYLYNILNFFVLQDGQTNRTLTLISKTIQSLCNLVSARTPRCNEEYMACMYQTFYTETHITAVRQVGICWTVSHISTGQIFLFFNLCILKRVDLEDKSPHGPEMWWLSLHLDLLKTYISNFIHLNLHMSKPPSFINSIIKKTPFPRNLSSRGLTVQLLIVANCLIFILRIIDPLIPLKKRFLY